MTAPSVFPLDIYHGDSHHWQFKLWLDEAKAQPVDLTTVTVKAEIRNKPAGADIYALSCEIVPPNIIEAVLTAPVCSTLPIGSLVWDLQLTYADGSVNTILAGAVTVTQDVTDSVDPLAPEVNPLRAVEAPPQPKALRAVRR